MLTIILTGGASRRMGRDKATLPVNGTVMALYLAEKYSLSGQVAFSVDEAGRFPTDSYRELPDHYPGRGPLNGVISAFLDTDEDTVFLTATDMPLGSAAAAAVLTEALGEHDACMYRDEPLFAVYRRSCLAAAVECMESGQYSMRAFLSRVDVKYLNRPTGRELTNLNTPEEYEDYSLSGRTAVEE